MDVNRRNLMKGVLTGSTLLALGIPPASGRQRLAGQSGRVRLLLGNGSWTRNLPRAPHGLCR